MQRKAIQLRIVKEEIQGKKNNHEFPLVLTLETLVNGKVKRVE